MPHLPSNPTSPFGSASAVPPAWPAEARLQPPWARAAILRRGPRAPPGSPRPACRRRAPPELLPPFRRSAAAMPSPRRRLCHPEPPCLASVRSGPAPPRSGDPVTHSGLPCSLEPRRRHPSPASFNLRQGQRHPDPTWTRSTKTANQMRKSRPGSLRPGYPRPALTFREVIFSLSPESMTF